MTRYGHARPVLIKKQYDIAFRRAKSGGKFAKHSFSFYLQEKMSVFKLCRRLHERLHRPRRENNCCITPDSRLIYRCQIEPSDPNSLNENKMKLKGDQLGGDKQRSSC